MAWLYLMIASIFEVVWAVGLKSCYDLKINMDLMIVLISMILSLIFLTLAVQKIPMGVAYAVWTGLGVVGVFLYSFFINKEAIPATSCIFVLLILVGVIGLKLNISTN